MQRGWCQWGRHPFPFSSRSHTLLPVHFWATRNSPTRALSNVALPKCRHELSFYTRQISSKSPASHLPPRLTWGSSSGDPGQAGLSQPGAPGLEGIPLHCPQVKSCPLTGKLLETAGTWKCCCHMVLLEVQLKQNEGSW